MNEAQIRKRLQELYRGYPMLYWNDVVDESHFLGFIDRMEALKEKGWPNQFMLCLDHNWGGDLYAAWMFYDYVKTSGLYLVTVATGDHVQSGALTLFLAGKERYASSRTVFYVHDPTLSPARDLEVSIRNVDAFLEEFTQSVYSLHERYLNLLSDATGQGKEVLDDLSRAQSSFSAERAKELGIVHHIF